MIALDAVRPLNQIPKKTVKPMKMQMGGEAIQDLAEGPPENIDMLPRFEGFEPGPNQFSLSEEETVIPSEPNVQPRTMDQRGSFFPVPEIKGPIPSEPNISSLPSMDRVTEGTSMGERFLYGPVIDPREIYPRDPDSGIMGFGPDNYLYQPQKSEMGPMGIPQLLNTGLQNNGIMDIVEKLRITKPLYDI